MRDNNLKRMLAAGQPAIGSNVTIPDPFSVEVMGGAGLAFVMVDTEHSAISIAQLQTMLVALRPTSSTVLVRVSGHGDLLIKQALDVGAEGVIVPSISTRQQCEDAVASARYAPVGRRGFGPRRASRLYGERSDYIKRANDEVMVIIMIETVEGMDNLEEIVTTPGLDGVLVGPGDLAVSMGYIHDLTNPAVEEATNRILSTCKRHGVPFGMFTATAELAAKWIERGAVMALLGSDVMYLDAGISKTRADITALLARHAEREGAALEPAAKGR